MDSPNIPAPRSSSAPQRLIAIGIVLAFLYWASSVVIAVLLATLFAYFLDPLVTGMQRIHIPRALGALVALSVAFAALGAVGYLLADRVDSFVEAWPRYSAVLKGAYTNVDRKLTSFDKQVSEISPNQRGRTPDAGPQLPSVRTVLLSGIGSLYSALFIWTFLPFMIFFMLAGKTKLWQATIGLFPESQSTEVKEALDEMSTMLRSYIAGNLLVAAILFLACWAFFWAIHLDYALVTALASGIFNLVPYLGAVLAWAPPFLIGFTKWNTIGPYLGIAGVLSVLHLLAMNVLMPAIVGRRVHLNALAATIALLFWGWLWGAAGLLLAIPITGAVKVICDHVPGWQPAGRWLGA